MKVLLTLPSLARGFGGPVAVGRALSEALFTLRQEVTVVGAGDAETWPAAVPLRPVARFHGTPIPLALHRVAAEVRQVDLVHVIGFRDPVGVAATLACRRWGVPWILEPAGMLGPKVRSTRLKSLFDRSLGRRVVEAARILIAASRVEAEEFETAGVPGERVALRPNGLKLSDLLPLPTRGRFRARASIPPGAPLVLALGRIARTKGLPELVEAHARLNGVHLVIAGPDQKDGTMARLTRRRDASAGGGRIHIFPQGLWGEEKREALADADVFCQVSLTESFGIAAAEAAACGLAVIVSDRCGVVDWLEGGVEVVPYGDVGALVGSLGSLLGDAARRSALGLAASRAAGRLGWDGLARFQLDLYQSVLRNERFAQPVTAYLRR